MSSDTGGITVSCPKRLRSDFWGVCVYGTPTAKHTSVASTAVPPAIQVFLASLNRAKKIMLITITPMLIPRIRCPCRNSQTFKLIFTIPFQTKSTAPSGNGAFFGLTALHFYVQHQPNLYSVFLS